MRAGSLAATTVVTPEASQPIGFSVETEAVLRRNGWRIVEVPSGLTLGVLRGMGAPFRGDRYFREFAPDVVETPTVASAVAFQPGFLPNSLNLRFDAAAALVEEFGRTVPVEARATLGSAATYVFLFWQEAKRTGTFPIAGYYTWTSDVSPEGNLIVGIFGRDRPIIVAPHAKSGAGVGVMPVLLPTW